MPSYPNPRYQKEPSYIFNPKTDPTFAGHLAEVLGRVQMLFVALMYNTQFVHGENMRNGS